MRSMALHLLLGVSGQRVHFVRLHGLRHKFIQVVRCQQRDYAGDGIAQACVAL